MSFLNNFRLQYHIKHIEKLFDEKNSIEAISYLRELKRNEELFYKLSLKYISKLINQSNDNILENKIQTRQAAFFWSAGKNTGLWVAGKPRIKLRFV